MKIQLDTGNKVIRLEESANLKELYLLLSKILPNKEWESYKIETNTQVVWTNPITITPYIQPHTYPWWRHEPIGQPYYGVTAKADYIFGGPESQVPGPNHTVGHVITTGIYNLEIES